VRSWQWEDEKKQYQKKLSAMFSELPPEMRTRYAHVADVCEAIRVNYSRLSATSQMFVKQMEEKLQGLQQGYVRLLWAAHQQREYLQLTNPAEIQREVDQLKKGLAADAPKVQDINRKRIEILTKRLEKFQKIRENRQVIDAQCAATEDVLQLIRDQSVTMDPQQISDQLENWQDVEQTEQSVKEVEGSLRCRLPTRPNARSISCATAARGSAKRVQKIQRPGKAKVQRGGILWRKQQCPRPTRH
jgi:hypothetical protein